MIYHDDGQAVFYHGDVRAVLRELPAESVQMCVTSPPYWSLRDYGVEPTVWGGDPDCEHEWGGDPDCEHEWGGDPDCEHEWGGDPDCEHEWGGDPDCEHEWGGAVVRRSPSGSLEGSTLDGSGPGMERRVCSESQFCRVCGAWLGALGLEPTPELYVAHIVEVFREVRRVLRKDGTLWLNIGDSYAATTKGSGGHNPKQDSNAGSWMADRISTIPLGMKPKDLVGIPWMVAFALRADGWWLRQDIIWSKPNPMPESVTDRCTKSHEYLFLLSKSARYYYDQAAIREAHFTWERRDGEMVHTTGGNRRKQVGTWGYEDPGVAGAHPDGRNKRDVWTIPTAPFAEAHFATFPPALVTPCILAGCPEAGRRCDCAEIINTPIGTGDIDDPSLLTGRAGMNRPRRSDEGTRPITRLEQRWHAEQLRAAPAEAAVLCGPAFAHYIRTDAAGARPLPEHLRLDFLARGWITEPPPCSHPVEPAGTVLDPFLGSGTTAMVAKRLGRRVVGIDLNAEYLDMAVRRCAQMGLFQESDSAV